jgi:hypothetical protein
MPLSFPLGPVAKAIRWMWKVITKKLLFKAYQCSHEMWARRHRLGTYWCTCGPHLEYSLHLALLTDPEPRTSLIAFRSTNDCISSLRLVFEAEARGIFFQEPIQLINIGRKPIVWTMRNVPYQDFIDYSEQTGLRFSYHRFRLRQVTLTLSEGQTVSPFDSLPNELTHTWFLNSKWKHRWGRFWNLDAIEEAQYRLRSYWGHCFCKASVRTYIGGVYMENRFQWLARMVTRPIAWIMSSKPAVITQFWTSIWSGLFVLNGESHLQWRWKNNRQGSSKTSFPSH